MENLFTLHLKTMEKTNFIGLDITKEFIERAKN